MDNTTESKLTDRHLVERVLSGDTSTFGIIIKNTEKLVAQIVFKMINNAEDRKDIAQDIYLKVFKKLPSFQYQSKLSTWIAQVSYNTCLDYLRKKKLLLPQNIFEEEKEGANDILDIMNTTQGNFGEPADTVVIRKNICEIVKKKIEKLPPIYKTLISFYHNEELSYEEIGKITGLPVGTVKSYLFRARRELKNELLLHYKKEDLW